MRGEAEVVVAAEVDAAPAVELDLGGVVREPAHGAAPAAEAALVEVREHGPEFVAGRPWPQLPQAAVSGRMPSRPNSAWSLSVSGLPVVRSFSP